MENKRTKNIKKPPIKATLGNVRNAMEMAFLKLRNRDNSNHTRKGRLKRTILGKGNTTQIKSMVMMDATMPRPRNQVLLHN